MTWAIAGVIGGFVAGGIVVAVVGLLWVQSIFTR